MKYKKTREALGKQLPNLSKHKNLGKTGIESSLWQRHKVSCGKNTHLMDF